MLYTILEFLSGLGIFLVGVKLLSNGLEKLSGSSFKKYITKFTKNSFGGVTLGTLMAFITQSSMAGVVMVMGFSSAGIIALTQAVFLIFGCNIGTSLSTVVVAFNTFSLSKFLAVFGVIGIILSQFFKNEKVRTWGNILAGFGLMFGGLNVLSGATEVFRSSAVFTDFLTSINNPLFYLLFGTLLTILTHSSTATVALLVALCGNGFVAPLSITNVAFAVYGANIGTALTTFTVALSGTVEARRVSFIHILFNAIGCVVFGLLEFTGWLKLFDFLNIATSFKIVIINIIFNVVMTILLYAFSKPIIKITNKVVKEKVDKENKIYILDETIFNVPSTAIVNLNTCLIDLIDKLDLILKEVKLYCENFALTHSKNIKIKTEKVYSLNARTITNALKVQTYANNSEDMERLYFIQLTCKNIERILDNYLKIVGYVKSNKDKKVNFTDRQKEEFASMFDLLEDIIQNTKTIINNINFEEDKKECFIPSITILQKADDIDIIKTSIKRETMEGNFPHQKRIEEYTMFLNIINCLDQIAVNFSDIALTITDFITKNKEI